MLKYSITEKHNLDLRLMDLEFDYVGSTGDNEKMIEDKKKKKKGGDAA